MDDFLMLEFIQPEKEKLFLCFGTQFLMTKVESRSLKNK